MERLEPPVISKISCTLDREKLVKFPKTWTWTGERRLQLVRCENREDAINAGLAIVEEVNQLFREAGVELERC